MNRRGFITAILAAPLAVVGSFAGNHKKVWAIHMPSFKGDMHISKPSTFKGPVGMWTNLFPDKDWVYVEFGDGKIVRIEEWHGKNPLFHVVTPPGDLCDQDKLKGTLLA